MYSNGLAVRWTIVIARGNAQDGYLFARIYAVAKMIAEDSARGVNKLAFTCGVQPLFLQCNGILSSNLLYRTVLLTSQPQIEIIVNKAMLASLEGDTPIGTQPQHNVCIEPSRCWLERMNADSVL